MGITLSKIVFTLIEYVHFLNLGMGKTKIWHLKAYLWLHFFSRITNVIKPCDHVKDVYYVTQFSP